MPTVHSQSTPSSPEPYVHPINQPIVAEFRANHGVVGGAFSGADLLLLTTVGARSGRPATSPLAYFRDEGRWLVVGSAGGSPRHPAWYHNLRARPAASVEIADRTLAVHARITEGAERDALFAMITARAPGYADYQSRVERRIPVVVLVPAAAGDTR
jgi:deazaflavin-dependent oxidoreductase (nitroreductase family)